MTIKLNNKTVKVILLKNFKEKIKSFRFKLTDIKEGICFYKKRNINTYFFCQRTDIIFTDKDNVVLKISRNTATEKFLFGKKGTRYIYILKSDSTNNLNLGDKLKVSLEKDEKEYLKS